VNMKNGWRGVVKIHVSVNSTVDLDHLNFLYKIGWFSIVQILVKWIIKY
jgi:hypothetical protein